MAEQAKSGRKLGWAWYGILLLLATSVTFGIFLLLENIAQRKEEAKSHVFRVVEVDENTDDPEKWGMNYPRQYDGYRRTVDTVRTRHGGSEAFQKLDANPHLRDIFSGYAFSIDHREERGHAFMLYDQDQTERVKVVAQPGACLHCHSSVIPAYLQAGLKTGIPNDAAHRDSAIMKGFEIVNAMPFHDARELVNHPVSCIDCHDANTMQLKVTRPGFIYGIRNLAMSDDPLPHLPSVEKWREGSRAQPYDPNILANRQEMRSFVCGQCHVEYYFKGSEKMLTYPWHKGLKADQMLEYYDEFEVKDWVHKLAGSNVLKAQHPEFEMWSQGTHARSGVSCSDCHMPYIREGAVKVSDHHIRSPVLNINNACQVCHNVPEAELKARVESIQDRTKGLMDRTEEALVEFIKELQAARENSAVDSKQLAEAQDLHRKAQWRLDFVASENSMGFHAPQEAARILGEAIDYVRQGQNQLKK